MKKNKTGAWVIFALLFACLLMTCDTSTNPGDGGSAYSGLRLNEISGEHKFVEIYNSGSKDISLKNVKLQRNDGPLSGGSEWVGTSSDSIPAGAYRIFLFNNFSESLDEKEAYKGWKVESGISDQQILKVALVDPSGNPIDVFIRGDKHLLPWGSTSGVERDRDHSYSRIDADTWVYADPTPGESNGPRFMDIVNPGYLQYQPDYPVITDFSRNRASITAADSVTVSATITTKISPIDDVLLKWTVGVESKIPITMKASAGNVYSAVIPAQPLGSEVTYWITAINKRGEDTDSAKESYTVVAAPIEYSFLKLNEVSGVGTDAEKFYELINTGTVDIPLEGVRIWYNANGSTGGSLPAGKGNLTWTGSADQVAEAESLYILEGRGNDGSFTTGLTAARILIITLEDPAGNLIDKCIRASDTGDYAITEKSFSRIPDGTGDFYFTEPTTPNASNGTVTAGLKKLPLSPPVISGLSQKPISMVTTEDAVKVSATITGTVTSAVVRWTLNDAPQTDITMTNTGSNYSVEIAKQAKDAVVKYNVYVTDDKGETATSAEQSYTVVYSAIASSKLKLNEVSGVGEDGDKFYELINIGTEPIDLEGYEIWYNANGSAGQSFPPNDNRLTWTGPYGKNIEPGELFSLIGRYDPVNNPDSFTTGLTAGRILIITLVNPAGEIVDQCIRARDTGAYAITDKSFSRIPDGEGDFYFTTPTPNVKQGTNTSGLTKVPDTPF